MRGFRPHFSIGEVSKACSLFLTSLCRPKLGGRGMSGFQSRETREWTLKKCSLKLNGFVSHSALVFFQADFSLFPPQLQHILCSVVSINSGATWPCFGNLSCFPRPSNPHHSSSLCVAQAHYSAPGGTSLSFRQATVLVKPAFNVSSKQKVK